MPKMGGVPVIIFGPRREKTCLWGFANITGADQPAHPRSLISTFVIHFWKVSYLNLLSIFYLVPVAEQAGLSLALSETPKTSFLTTRPIFASAYSLRQSFFQAQ